MTDIHMFVPKVLSKFKKAPSEAGILKEILSIIENNEELLKEYTDLLSKQNVKTLNLLLEEEVRKAFGLKDSYQKHFTSEYQEHLEIRTGLIVTLYKRIRNIMKRKKSPGD